MKSSLQQHIRNIYTVLNINADFQVIDTEKDEIPQLLDNILVTNKYIVLSDAVTAKDLLASFIGKEIFQLDNCIYWFEGESIINNEQHNNVIEDILPKRPIEKLKVQTRLPSWLDNFIFKTLQAEYAPDHQRFEYNLDLTYEDNKKYLGTYFPRSYAETFCIFDNIFCNDVIKSKYSQQTEVNILSVGCGTGGDILGLLTAINKHFASIKKINIVAIDGNDNALTTLSQIISQAHLQFHKEIVIETKQIIFDTITSACIKTYFDFIITSKMINEIINKGEGRLDNSYYDFAKIYSPMMKVYGIMMILDVTTKVGGSDFCPILLNRQINRFVYEYSDFVSIIPIPCSKKENCQAQCFSQKEFTVSHSRYTNDKSRIAYRILVRKNWLHELHLELSDAQYQIQPEGYCGQGSIIADGFFLPNITNNVNKNIDNKDHVEPTIKQSNFTQEDVNHTDICSKIIETTKKEETTIIQQSKQLGEVYVIDTNAFIYAPNIIEKISEKYPIFISAKVVDELDHRKDVTSGNDKKKVQKALKSINMAISSGRVRTITSDARFLPADFDRRSSDNLILSVALKLKKKGYTPILVTSDNGFQIKAKTLKIKTIPYTKVKSKI